MCKTEIAAAFPLPASPHPHQTHTAVDQEIDMRVNPDGKGGVWKSRVGTVFSLARQLCKEDIPILVNFWADFTFAWGGGGSSLGRGRV